ncbi:MAG: redoxin domain-containing protein [Phycisphaerales bacterium]|nr:MAG: redoxin domain-containing protein [Phycisphaerales bacterium]
MQVGNVNTTLRHLSCLLAAAVITVGTFDAQAKPPSKKAGAAKDVVAAPDKPAKTKPDLPPGDKRPRIVVDEPAHDFGETWIGPKLNHTFTIKNEGTELLEIQRVKPACGCTVAGKYPDSIKPGKLGQFPFIVNSKKLRGKYEKAITIQTNDPINPVTRLKLRGVCNRYVDVVPTSANFGKLAYDEPHKRVLKITNNTEGPLQVSVDKKSEGEFNFDIVEITPGKDYELHISMEPPYEERGNYRAEVNIVTNIDAQKSIPVRTSASVPERLDLQPAVVTLSRSKMNRAYTRPVRFYNYGPTDVKVLGATCDDTKITAEIKERSAGRSYTVKLAIPEGYTPPDGTTVTIKTDDPAQPELKVPMMIEAPRQAKKSRDRGKRGAELMLGQWAPDFSLSTTEGKSLSKADLRDKVTVLDFWAPNCGYCKRQIPRMEEIRKAYEAKGVRFVAVSQKMGQKEYSDDEVKATIDGLGYKGELAIDSANTLGPLFQARSYPTMVILGKQGKIDAVNLGNIADLETRMKGQLDALLAGKPVPTFEAKTAAADKKKPRKRPAEEMIGKKAPTFAFETMNGKKYSTAELAKHPATVLNFVAPNCGYCKKQVPRLEKIRQEYEAKGVSFVNVAEKMRKEYEPAETAKIFKDIGSNLDLAIDSENVVGGLFKARGFPTMVVLGKSGNVEAVNVGNIGDLETRLKGQLDALIAGKPASAAVPVITADAKRQPDRKTPTKPAAKGDLDERIGKPAPQFSFETTDGKKVSNAELAGAPAMVLNFVAPNCGFCKKQVPRVEGLRAGYEAKGIRFINVAQTMRKKYEPAEAATVFSSIGSGLEFAYDGDNKFGKMFGARGFPTMIVLGKSGKIEAVNTGNIGNLEEQLKGQLDALVAGKPVPKKYLAAKRAKRARPAEGMKGKKAPSFDIKTLDGKPVNNAEFAKYKATVLNFVAPNCGFCKRQLPNVEKVRAEYEAKGVRFVNVAMKMKTAFTVDETVKVFEGVGSQLELATDFDNTTGGKFKATSFPTMMVVDSAGTIKEVNIGAKKNLETLLKGQLDKMTQ